MTRTEQRENLIRNLRRDPRLFDDTPESDQIERLIRQAKKLCAPTWRERHNKHMSLTLDRWMAIQ